MKLKYTLGIFVLTAAIITTLVLVANKEKKVEDDYLWIMW